MIMDKKDYPEIRALTETYKKHSIEISVSDDEFLFGNKNYPAVTFSLGEKLFRLFADDEYHDFSVNNPILSLCIILRELEDYEYADDYIVWCKQHAFDTANLQVRDYHMSLRGIFNDVEKILGKIDSQISDIDFELNAGAAQKLRETK